MRGTRGGVGTGVQTPLETHENIGSLSNTGLDPLKYHKATKPSFKFGPLPARQRNAIYSLAGRCCLAYSGICLDPLSLLKLKIQNKKHTLSKLTPPHT